MDRLIAGVRTFQRDVYPQNRDLFQQLADGQSPGALFITCADSRVVPSMMTQTPPGELFICRNAGNMVPPYGEVNGGVSATIEYAVCVLNVEHIIVCGHSDCGAVKALLTPEKLEGMPTVKSWLAHGERARRIVLENHRELSGDALMHALTKENIVAQLENLRTHPSVAARMARGALAVHGWMYHIGTGNVDVYDPSRGHFVPISEYEWHKPEQRATLTGAR
jgi:carbonic anhydrase